MVSTLLIYLAIGLPTLLIVLGTGRFIVRLFDQTEIPTEWKIFRYGLAGLLTLVSLVAIIRTGGQTVFITIPLFTCGIWMLRRKTIQVDFSNALVLPGKNQLWHAVLPLVLFTGFLLWNASGFCSLEKMEILIPNRDIIYYGSLSESLWNVGEENHFFYASEASSQLKGMVPYHYFTEWFNALVHGSFRLNPTLSFLLISCPVLATVATSGFAGIARKLLPDSKVITTFFIGLSGLFFTLVIPFDVGGNEYFKHVEMLSNTPMEHTMNLKLLPIYLVLILVLYLFLSKRFREAICYLILLPVMNVSCSPSVLLTIPLLCVLLLFLKRYNWVEFIRILGISATIGTSLILMYLLFGNTASSEILGNEGAGFSDYFTRSYKLDIRYLLKWVSIETVSLVSVPALLLVSIKLTQHSKSGHTRLFITSSLFLWLGGMLAWVFLRMLGHDSYQFLAIAGMPALTISAWLVCCMGLSGKIKWMKGVSLAILLIFCSVSIYNYFANDHTGRKYSYEFTQRAAQINEELGNPAKVVSLNTTSYEKTVSNKDPYMSPTLCGAYWFLQPGKDVIHNLDALELKPSNAVGRMHERRMIQLALISVWDSQREELSIDGHPKLEFIDDIGARLYMYESGVIIPPEIERRIEEKITDPISGETLAIISSPPQ